MLTYGNAGIGDELSTTLNYSTALLSNQLSLNLYVGATYADYRLTPSYRARALSYGTRGWSLEWGGSVNYYHPKGWLASLDLSADRALPESIPSAGGGTSTDAPPTEELLRW